MEGSERRRILPRHIATQGPDPCETQPGSEPGQICSLQEKGSLSPPYTIVFSQK